MRRVSIAIALTLSLLCFVCAAQQHANNTTANPKQNDSPTPPPGPVIGGMGTVNYIPIWAAPTFLLNSVIYQANGGNVGIGTTAPAAKLDVNGGINTATTYQIGGIPILSDFSGNLLVGRGAGRQLTSGGQNAFVGDGAGGSNTIGNVNSFFGNSTGISNNTGSGNSFFGYSAGNLNTTGSNNTFLGAAAGQRNDSGSYNTFSGYEAGNANVGSANTFSGYRAGYSNTTGNNNIYIGNFGSTSGAESSTIRIGGDIGLGLGPQTAAYIAGIYGSTSASGVPVSIDSNGQLGTQTSSLRFKEQVADMGDSTSALMKLRPVIFFYKPEYEKGERTLQYGLIAEEVAQVYPELVAYDKEGQPYTVRYQYLSTMLLNEVQKQHTVVSAQQDVIRSQQEQIQAQQQKIDALEQRLSRLEAIVDKHVEVVQK